MLQCYSERYGTFALLHNALAQRKKVIASSLLEPYRILYTKYYRSIKV